MKVSDINEYLVPPSITIEQAIKRLDELPIKLLLVVRRLSGKCLLLGTVTDGDIRRALLKYHPLSSSIEGVMNKEPKSLLPDDSSLMAKGLMQQYGIHAVPVVNEQGQILDLIKKSPQAKKRDNAVFLMAGGFGTRLRPLTNDCPKPMLKVGDKPILETIMEQFISRGFHNFYISTHYLNEQIEGHFGNGSKYGVNIDYIHEDIPLGTAGAIGLLPNDIKEKSIILMNGDLLTNMMFDEFLDYHLNEVSSISVGVKEYSFQVPFGVIDHSGNEISGIVEKPIHKEFINAGVYCITPEVMSSVKQGEYLDMPTLIQNALAEKNKVAMFPIHEYWLDIGRYSDYEKAQSEYYDCFHKSNGHLKLVHNG